MRGALRFRLCTSTQQQGVAARAHHHRHQQGSLNTGESPNAKGGPNLAAGSSSTATGSLTVGHPGGDDLPATPTAADAALAPNGKAAKGGAGGDASEDVAEGSVPFHKWALNSSMVVCPHNRCAGPPSQALLHPEVKRRACGFPQRGKGEALLRVCVRSRRLSLVPEEGGGLGKAQQQLSNGAERPTAGGVTNSPAPRLTGLGQVRCWVARGKCGECKRALQRRTRLLLFPTRAGRGERCAGGAARQLHRHAQRRPRGAQRHGLDCRLL